MLKNKSLGENAIYSIIYKTLNVIFPLVSMVYVSRVLLSDGVGRISAVNNNVSYFLILATLGIPTYGLREIAKNRDSHIEKSKIFNELFFINLILTISTFLIYFAVVLRIPFFEDEKKLYIILGLTILLNIFNVDWLFQGLEEYGYIAARSTIVKTISLLAIFVLVRNKSDIYIYAVIRVVAISGNYIFNILHSRNFVKFDFRCLNFGRHIKPLAYLALCSVSTELYAKMDISMLDVMSSHSVVGYYTSSQKIITLVVSILIAVTAVFMPRLSFLFGKNKDEFNRILKIGFDLMVLISIPSCVGLIIISKPLVVSFLGRDFENAATTLSILSLMIPLKCVGDLICYQVMMCAGKEALLMKSYFITMIVNLINNLILIPRLGAEGASIASVISEVLAFVFVLYYSRDYFELSGISNVLGKTLVCSAIMVIAVIPCTFFISSPYLKLIIELFVGVASFVLACFIMKHDVFFKYVDYLNRKFRG